jgi:hypothetical protein
MLRGALGRGLWRPGAPRALRHTNLVHTRASPPTPPTSTPPPPSAKEARRDALPVAADPRCAQTAATAAPPLEIDDAKFYSGGLLRKILVAREFLMAQPEYTLRPKVRRELMDNSDEIDAAIAKLRAEYEAPDTTGALPPKVDAAAAAAKAAAATAKAEAAKAERSERVRQARIDPATAEAWSLLSKRRLERELELERGRLEYLELLKRREDELSEDLAPLREFKETLEKERELRNQESRMLQVYEEMDRIYRDKKMQPGMHLIDRLHPAAQRLPGAAIFAQWAELAGRTLLRERVEEMEDRRRRAAAFAWYGARVLEFPQEQEEFDFASDAFDGPIRSEEIVMNDTVTDLVVVPDNTVVPWWEALMQSTVGWLTAALCVIASLIHCFCAVGHPQPHGRVPRAAPLEAAPRQERAPT